MRQALAAFGMHDTAPVDEYYRVLSQPGAMTGALNWYRANDMSAAAAHGGLALPAVTVPTMYVWSTDDQALGREAAEATAAWVEGPYRFEVLRGREPLGARRGPGRAERAPPRPFRECLTGRFCSRLRRSGAIRISVTPPVYRRSRPRVLKGGCDGDAGGGPGGGGPRRRRCADRSAAGTTRGAGGRGRRAVACPGTGRGGPAGVRGAGGAGSGGARCGHGGRGAHSSSAPTRRCSRRSAAWAPRSSTARSH